MKGCGYSRLLLAGIAWLGTAACTGSAPPLVSDTGYTGTWSRGNLRGSSIVAIARDGEHYRFRWSKMTYGRGGERKLVVRCDWDGRCTETLDGKTIATYAFRTWVDETTGRLMVEGIEERLEPERLTNRFVDELVLENEGRTLRRYTLERRGETFTGAGRPMAAFEKVSNGLAEPPRP